MTLPTWMRVALFATAAMNLVAAAAFVPAAQPLRAAAGLPDGGHPLYPMTVSLFVLLFGLAYLWAAVTGRVDRLFIAVAAAGKLAFFTLVMWFWAADALPMRAPLLAAADLVFGTAFLTWLCSVRSLP